MKDPCARVNMLLRCCIKKVCNLLGPASLMCLAKSLIPLTRLGAHGSPRSDSAQANLF